MPLEKPLEKFKTLRIDQVPETNDSEDDDDETFLGRTTFKKQRSPEVQAHLTLNDENMFHFKALSKYYGLAPLRVRLPACAQKATGTKFEVMTPDA